MGTLQAYKQCCLRTFIVKVLNEALKIDKEFKHGIGTNDVTMTVVHYRVSVWKSVDGTWECCRVRNSMKWRTTIPYSDILLKYLSNLHILRAGSSNDNLWVISQKAPTVSWEGLACRQSVRWNLLKKQVLSRSSRLGFGPCLTKLIF